MTTCANNKCARRIPRQVAITVVAERAPSKKTAEVCSAGCARKVRAP